LTPSLADNHRASGSPPVPKPNRAEEVEALLMSPAVKLAPPAPMSGRARTRRSRNPGSSNRPTPSAAPTSNRRATPIVSQPARPTRGEVPAARAAEREGVPTTRRSTTGRRVTRPSVQPPSSTSTRRTQPLPVQRRKKDD
jgi:hypothetical protein